MVSYFKRGAAAAAGRSEADRKVRYIAEGILADIAARGDSAIRELDGEACPKPLRLTLPRMGIRSSVISLRSLIRR